MHPRRARMQLTRRRKPKRMLGSTPIACGRTRWDRSLRSMASTTEVMVAKRVKLGVRPEVGICGSMFRFKKNDGLGCTLVVNFVCSFSLSSLWTTSLQVAATARGAAEQGCSRAITDGQLQAGVLRVRIVERAHRQVLDQLSSSSLSSSSPFSMTEHKDFNDISIVAFWN